jgi:hypothetical protein
MPDLLNKAGHPLQNVPLHSQIKPHQWIPLSDSATCPSLLIFPQMFQVFWGRMTVRPTAVNRVGNFTTEAIAMIVELR